MKELPAFHFLHNSHFRRTGVSLMKAVYITAGFFLLLFVTLHIGGAIYASCLGTKATKVFQMGISRDLAYLKEQGDAVAQNPLLIQHLVSQDFSGLMTILQEEKSARSIGLMGIVNAEGVVVGRTQSAVRRGDNAFLVSPIGRVVAQGKSAESVEMTSGFDPRQLFLTTGRPIMQNGEMVGGLFANYLADDAYAARFRDLYLPKGVQVVFYNKKAGVYGQSFSDPDTRRLISSYFNSGSEWIQNGTSEKTVALKNGSFYLIENTVFPGLEQSPGGALIFIPRRDISGILNILTAILTLAIFACFANRYHLSTRGEIRGWQYYGLFVLASVPVFVLALFALHAQNIGYLRLERVPYMLYNSTIRLQPEFGVYDVDFEQRFSIVVDTGDEAINAVQIGVQFDPRAVQIKMLDTANSNCSYVIENTVDPFVGRADLSCVMLKSGGERGSLVVADIVAVPRRPGAFALSFDKEVTKVLANDGLGTDVLRMSQEGGYQADDFGATGSQKDPMVVFSPSHPNEARWYNSQVARFVWHGTPTGVYAYAFDSSPDTIPLKSHTTRGSSIDIPIPGDGIFYFHLQSIAGGQVAHYRVQADRTPPTITSMNLSMDTIVAGDVVRFLFNADDISSGVQKNYYVDLGNHLFLPIGSQLFIPFLEAGNQKVILRVYDAAGNYSEKSKVIHVQSR
jgi:hypothetical protein